jgi:hypothetical protein
MCHIPARVKSLFGCGRFDVCPRNEGKFALNISLGGHGVCSYAQGWIGTHRFRGIRYPGCSSEAWHQAGYDIHRVETTCSGV